MEMDDVTREDRAQFGPVSSEGDGVRHRRERLGMHKNELAVMAGVSRDTLAAIEAGDGFRRATLTKIERALDAAEHEVGLDDQPAPQPAEPHGPQMVTIERTEGDVKVVVSGPIESADKLAETVERLMAWRAHQDEPTK